MTTAPTIIEKAQQKSTESAQTKLACRATNESNKHTNHCRIKQQLKFQKQVAHTLFCALFSRQIHQAPSRASLQISPLTQTLLLTLKRMLIPQLSNAKSKEHHDHSIEALPQQKQTTKRSKCSAPASPIKRHFKLLLKKQGRKQMLNSEHKDKHLFW